MLRFPYLLVSALILSSTRAYSPAPDSRALQDVNIREAAFRFLLHPYPLSERTQSRKHVREPARNRVSKEEPSPFKVYFLSVDDKDPSPALIKQFSWHRPPIKKLSDSYTDTKSEDAETRGYWVRDKKTKETGCIYFISSIRWISRSKVELDGGFSAGGLFGWSNTYTLKRQGKTWKVVHIKIGPVS